MDNDISDSLYDNPELVSDINTTDLFILDAIDGDTFTRSPCPLLT
jgi:hypothetical protein